jgi:energy-coupling factor transporter transmembrane protein EcfT
MEKAPIQDSQKLETLRMLYPLFKQEVFDRRDRIMKIAGLASGFLLLLMFWILYFVVSSWLLIIGVIIFTGIIIATIKQHSRRHAQAKLGVIEIEKALGLFESGAYFPDQPLYPAHWKTRPTRDYGLIFYSSCLIALALLVILSLLMTL